jgi:hypothetical protein
MTYTGLSPVIFAHDLPAATDPRRTDIWLRTDTGEEVLVQAAIRTGNTVTVTAETINWPRRNTSQTLMLPADSRISTRIY